MKKFGYITQDKFGNTFYTKKAESFGKKIFETMTEVADNFTKDSGVGAYFSFKDNCIYINKDNSEYICEWMIVSRTLSA